MKKTIYTRNQIKHHWVPMTVFVALNVVVVLAIVFFSIRGYAHTPFEQAASGFAYITLARERAFQADVCSIINNVIGRVQQQLNTVLKPYNKVGVQHISILDYTFDAPDVSMLSMDTAAFSDILPDYLKTSDRISLQNENSTWDNIFVSDHEDDTSPFRIELDRPKDVMIYSLAEPVCSNMWANVLRGSIFNIVVRNIASSIQFNIESLDDCLHTRIGQRHIRSPFSLKVDPEISFDLDGAIELWTGYCVYGPVSINPLNPDFYRQPQCRHDVSVPCPERRNMIREFDVRSHVSIPCRIEIFGTFECDVSVRILEGQAYLSNIVLHMEEYDIIPAAHIDMNISSGQYWFDALGGQEKIASKINETIHKFSDVVINEIFSNINRELDGKTI